MTKQKISDKETFTLYSLDSPYTGIYVKTKGLTLDLLWVVFFLPQCLIFRFIDGLNFD